MMSFRDYVLLREGLLLPDKPPTPGKPRINTTPWSRRRTRTLKPRKVRIARTPTVRNVRVARIPNVPTA